MMEILLFPLNEDTETLALHMKENPDYHIRAVSGYQEDTEKLREFQRKSGIFVSVDFRACLDMADAVIFAESTMGHGYDCRGNGGTVYAELEACVFGCVFDSG